MVAIKSFSSFFWRIDPGFFNLKLAARTVLAIILSLWIVQDDLLLTRMMAGIGSGIAMQGVVAQTGRLRVLHVTVFTLFYFSVFALGLAVRHSPIWTAVTLTGLGFFVNYIRRFGLEKSIAPFMVWILCFLATILPFTSTHQAWVHIYGLLVGLVVAACVTLFVFPNNYQKLFINNVNLFFKSLSLGMESLRRQILIHDRNLVFGELPFVQVKQNISRLVDSNQTILYSPAFKKEESEFSTITASQYALINAYSLLLDAYSEIWHKDIRLSHATLLIISSTCKQVANICSAIHVDDDGAIINETAESFMPKLGKRLGEKPALDPETIIILLNFKLGFELLAQNINYLTRIKNES